VCGDGITAAPETCDDGATTPGDGCDGSCFVESPYTCLNYPLGGKATINSACTLPVVCGDGITAAPETCDDGATTPGDGCDASCAVETPYTCSNSPSVCVFTCGSGSVSGGE